MHDKTLPFFPFILSVTRLQVLVKLIITVIKQVSLEKMTWKGGLANMFVNSSRLFY